MMQSKNYVKELAEIINQYKGSTLKFMEVCGTHTVSIFKHGVRELLPDNIVLLSGPGCPVCVTPEGYIDNAIKISQSRGTIITTFGDMMRVPGSHMSLDRARALGGDIRVVYSPLDSLAIAENNPDKKVVFLAVGFETTVPVIALSIKKAKEMGLQNFYVLCSMKLIIPALKMLCNSEINIDGFLLPGHVSAIIGQDCYTFLAKEYKKACAIAGFEAYDILYSLVLMVDQLKQSEYKIENTYTRVVNRYGNPKANKLIFEIFEVEDSLWRGIGAIEKSGLKIKEEFQEFDAKNYFELKHIHESTKKGCLCGEVIKGIKSPYDCTLFGKVCNPINPVGACMVSSEGTCAAYYKYGRK